MTLDEKNTRDGLMALGGLNFVLSALGQKVTPLEPIGGFGTH
jgi:hypothetical protein